MTIPYNMDNYDKMMKNQVHIWSRRPAEGYNRVIDWYDTLLELVAKISNGGDIITSPEVACIFETTLNFRAKIDDFNHWLSDTPPSPYLDVYRMKELGKMRYKNEKTWTLHADPFFKRNKIVINPGTLEEQEIVVNHLLG